MLDMMFPDTFFALLAVGFAGAALGYVVAYRHQLQELRRELNDKVTEFNHVTKLASEANNSMAEKLVSMDQRLDTVETWRSMMSLNISQTPPTSSWKK